MCGRHCPENEASLVEQIVQYMHMHTDKHTHRCPRTERALLLIHLTFMTAQHMDKPNMLGSSVPGLSVVTDIFQSKKIRNCATSTA